MTFWFVTLAVFAFLIALGFAFLRALHKASLGIPLLRAIVSTQDAVTYFVKCDDLNTETQPVEYVWLVLLSAAKMLFVMGSDTEWSKPKTDLVRTIECLGRVRLDPNTDVISLCNRMMVVVDAGLVAPTKLRFVATVGFMNLATRGFHTEIPWALRMPEDFYPDCWIAIVVASLPKLDEQLRSQLQNSLAQMAHAYRTGKVDPASRQGLRLPAMCFNGLV